MPFRVFLSYARADEKSAQWLRRKLNSFRAPRALVGVAGANGPVPDRLEAITSTRAIPAEGTNSSTQREAVLSGFDAMIVLCSPASASDVWVNGEIDAYVALGRLRRVITVVTPDAPDVQDVEREFFPPAVGGRGLFGVDMRQIRLAETVIGDGREGGVLKLAAALFGIGVDQVAEQTHGRQRLQIAGFAALSAALAATAVAGGGYALLANSNAARLSVQLRTVNDALEEANQRADAALEANRAAATEQAQAQAAYQSANTGLQESVRQLMATSTAALDEIAATHAATPARVRTIQNIERAYWALADVSPYFQFRAASVAALLEKIARTYDQIERPEDARRVGARFARFNQRVAANHDADPEWRSAYAASVLAIAGQRAASDQAGQLSGMAQAGVIFAGLCEEAAGQHEGSAGAIEARVGGCMRAASTALSRARLQSSAGQRVDAAPLDRARAQLEAAITAHPEHTRLQSAGAQLRDELERASARATGASQ